MYPTKSMEKCRRREMRGIGGRVMLLLATMLAALTISSGVALAATISCRADAECYGTRMADTLAGTDEDDDIFGRGGSDVIKGQENLDYLYGQGGSDKLIGGPDDDLLTGGSGDDVLRGGTSPASYTFDNGWGEDTLVDPEPDPSNEVDTLDFRRYSTQYVAENLIIKLFPSEGPEVTNLDGTDTIDWEGNPIEQVRSGDGDDEITGDSLANILVAHAGNDTINGSGGHDTISGGAGADIIAGEAGNDTIYANDGSGGDTVDCGEDFIADHDTVYYDLLDQVANNCEEKHLTTQLPNP
jgi:Ca2+-binding RTX toxin-like protein